METESKRIIAMGIITSESISKTIYKEEDPGGVSIYFAI